MPDWATALIVLGSGPGVPPAGGGVLASSALLDAGGGAGSLSFLDRAAWKETLAAAPDAGGRALRVWDALVSERPVEPVGGWYVELAADLGTAALEFDDPTVTGALRRTLAAYLPMIGTRLVAISSLMSDWRSCAGALTVFEADSDAEALQVASEDPWRSTFPGRLFRLDRPIIRRLPPPPGPFTQRYGSANPWPGGRFG